MCVDEGRPSARKKLKFVGSSLDLQSPKFVGHRKMLLNRLNTSTGSTRNIKIFCGTWNLGNSPPPRLLKSWIPPNEYDIYAIGVQECIYTQRKDMAGNENTRVVKMIGLVR
eukprot:TRINITY_DN5602_c0_g1_i1.p1 TRINITY_DN5602_c0_g1~~TRINITY_DN5602_c0_g1_i1.p1  ORF type:complete len:111 (+),score=4.81 TRINITY_DN5602_c0_g1_i1:129-461(+)